jgi:hypothetical protein
MSASGHALSLAGINRRSEPFLAASKKRMMRLSQVQALRKVCDIHYTDQLLRKVKKVLKKS